MNYEKYIALLKVKKKKLHCSIIFVTEDSYLRNSKSWKEKKRNTTFKIAYRIEEVSVDPTEISRSFAYFFLVNTEAFVYTPISLIR